MKEHVSVMEKPAKTTAVPPFLEQRLGRLRELMKKHKIDGYLVQNRMDQYYLTGFTGEDGMALVTRKDVTLLTDGRFDETADKEAPFAKKIVRKRRSPDVTAKHLRKLKAARIGFEPSHMSVSEFTGLKTELGTIRLQATSGLVSSLRQIKDADEIRRIRESIRIADRAFQQLSGWIHVGMTEREVAARLIFDMQVLGAQGPSFAPIIAVGANASLPHYEPADEPIRDGSVVLVDWGAKFNWYVSDLTRVLVVGSIAPELQQALRVVREAHDRAIAVIKPGIKASAVDKAAREFIDNSGFGKNFNHSVGHGIGLNVHEAPGLRKKADDRLKPGMVVTVEPGIYLPGVGGIRLEDDILVTETGYEVLSSSLPLEFAPIQ